jgi:hypothetical protein
MSKIVAGKLEFWEMEYEMSQISILRVFYN